MKLRKAFITLNLRSALASSSNFCVLGLYYLNEEEDFKVLSVLSVD